MYRGLFARSLSLSPPLSLWRLQQTSCTHVLNDHQKVGMRRMKWCTTISIEVAAESIHQMKDPTNRFDRGYFSRRHKEDIWSVKARIATDPLSARAPQRTWVRVDWLWGNIDQPLDFVEIQFSLSRCVVTENDLVPLIFVYDTYYPYWVNGVKQSYNRTKSIMLCQHTTLPLT